MNPSIEYNLKLDEFVAKLKKDHPGIHAKAIYVPESWYLKICQIIPQSNLMDAVIGHLAISDIKWTIRSTRWWNQPPDDILVQYKGKDYLYPISDLIEEAFTTKLNELIDE